jgi:hypothetical protein
LISQGDELLFARMADPLQILSAARSILLVDWPNPGVPRALLGAGLDVFGHSPAGYRRAELAASPPQDVNPQSIFAPPDQNETGYLVFRPMAAPPQFVDIVAVYRPAAELPGILAGQAVPLGAKALWFLRPISSAQELALVEAQNLVVVEEPDIIATAQAARRPP